MSQDWITCILMASGRSARYGKNKLLEKLAGREVILRTADSLRAAGLEPLAVTRSDEVRALMAREGIACVRHDGPRKSDTLQAGLLNLAADAAGFLFVPADQPAVQPDSLKRLVARFRACPDRAVRLGFRETLGSPVLFPAALRADLLAYRGDRGGMDVLRQSGVPCDVVQAKYEWELWDIDTPDDLARLELQLCLLDMLGACRGR